jgi:hypothetical protein
MAQNPWDEYQPTAAPTSQGVLIPNAPEKPKEAPSGYRYNAEGNVEFIPGGPADPSVKKDTNPSEGDKKVLQLLTRIAGGATDIQNALLTNPEAQQSGFIEAASRGTVGEGMITRAIAGEDRRIVTDTQGDVLDALLTLGTGAAYNEEQKIANRIAYFPQYGDTEREIAIKNEKLNRQIAAARIAAGPLAAEFDKSIQPLLNVVQGTVQKDAAGREIVPAELRVAQGAEYSTDADFKTRQDNAETWSATQGLPFDQAIAKFNADMKAKDPNFPGAGKELIDVLQMWEKATPGERNKVQWELPKTGVRESGGPGAAAAVASSLISGYSGGLAEEAVNLFDKEAAAKLEAAKQYSREEYPATALTGEIIGGIMSPINKIIPGAPAAAPAKEAIIQTAKQGALYGGVSGFGNAAPDAGILERIPGTIIGAATGGASGAAAQKYITPAVTSAVEKYVAPVVSRLITPTAGEAVSAAEAAGIPLITSDIVRPKTWFGRWTQETLEKIPGIGTGGARAAQRDAREAAITKLSDDYAAGTAEIDDITRDFLKVRGEQIGKLTREKGDVLDKVSGSPVDVSDTLSVIDNGISKYAGLEAYKPLIAKLQSFRNDLISGDISKIELTRKAIGGALGDDTLKPVASELKKVVGDIYPALRQDMGRHIQKFGEAGDFAKWRSANAALSDFATDLENATIKRVLAKGTATPEEAKSLLFSKKPSEVRALFGSLSDEGKANARALIVQDMIEKSGGIDSISPAKFATQLKQSASKIGVAFESSEAARLSGLLRALQFTRRADQAAVTTPTGQALLPVLATGGAAYLSPTAGAAGLVLSSIVAGARVFETKAVKNLLVALSRTAPGSKAEQNVLGSLGRVVSQQSGRKGGENGQAITESMNPPEAPTQ